MRLSHTLCLFVFGVLLGANAAMAQQGARPAYDLAYIGPPLADSLMQHNKETYVIYGCAYCHGVTLTPRGEAPDLRTSALVGSDVDGDLIGQILRAGIPQTPKLSPMPQYSDLSDQEIDAIASYIHYARARVRYQQLRTTPGSAGTVTAGKAYFDENCTSCHATNGDLAGIGSKHDAAALPAQILEPDTFGEPVSFRLDDLRETSAIAGRARHQALLENYAASDFANLVAYLGTLK